ncbi:hypothetical protein CcaCcLH18_05496 [Colletotrichum camelliae]|nr:hypothetical protein CcaCcLH18_05496 [Colletotrichum camelliae]
MPKHPDIKRPSCPVASDECSTREPDERQHLKACLTTLPTELIILITEALVYGENWEYYDLEEEHCCYSSLDEVPKPFPCVRAATRLGSTCKRLRYITEPLIMHTDIEHCYSSSLLLSAKRGSVEGVAKALAHGANINTLDRTIFDFKFTESNGYEGPTVERIPTKSTLTALPWAAFFGHTDVVAFLLANGADVNARANMGMQWSTYWSNPDEFPDPLNHGHPQRMMLCPTQDDFESEWSRGRDRGHDDARYWIGASPLFLALKAVQDTKLESSRHAWDDWNSEPIVETDNSGCRLRIARMLVDAKASLITRLRGSIHAIHQACAYRDYEVVRFLVFSLGVDVSITDRDGNSALHYMAMHLFFSPWVNRDGYIIPHPIERQKLIIRLLLDKGLDLNLKNNRGFTAKDMGLDIADDGDGKRTMLQTIRTGAPQPCMEGLPPEIILIIVDILGGRSGEASNAYDEKKTIDTSYMDIRFHPEKEEHQLINLFDMPFGGIADALHLASTCKYLYETISPATFKYDIKHHYSSSLLLSAKKDNIIGVKKAILHGADVWQNQRREKADVPLWACFHGNAELAKFLLESGHTQSSLGGFGCTRYVNVGGYGKSLELGLLMKLHPSRAMLCHTQKEYEEMRADDRLGQRWDAEGLTGVGASPLFFALKSCPDELRSQWQSTRWCNNYPIVESDVSGRRLAVARVLIEGGASLITRERGKIHAIHQACAARDTDVVSYLLNELGVDPNVTCENGNTALHFMAMNLHHKRPSEQVRIDFPPGREQSVIDMLISKGADLSLQNNTGWRADGMGLPFTKQNWTDSTQKKRERTMEIEKLIEAKRAREDEEMMPEIREWFMARAKEIAKE